MNAVCMGAANAESGMDAARDASGWWGCLGLVAAEALEKFASKLSGRVLPLLLSRARGEDAQAPQDGESALSAALPNELVALIVQTLIRVALAG